YPLHVRRQPRVVARPAQHLVEDAHQVHDVRLDVLPLRRRPFVQVEQLEIEAEPVPVNDDVLRVQVAVIFARVVHLLHALDQRVQEVHRRERLQALPRLAPHEVAELLAFHVLRDEYRDGHAPPDQLLARVVLDDDGAVPELVQLARVELRGTVAAVALREEELRCALDARGALHDLVDLSLPAHAEELHDLVLATDDPARLQVEAVDADGGGAVHCVRAVRRAGSGRYRMNVRSSGLPGSPSPSMRRRASAASWRAHSAMGPLRIRAMISSLCRLSISPSVAISTVSRGARRLRTPMEMCMSGDPMKLETRCRSPWRMASRSVRSPASTA